MSENFNLIWGSNASQTTVWNDSDYQRGWETIGDTPPTAQQFDALQRRNDLKAQELNNTIAPIAEANDANNRKPQTVYNVGDMQYDSQLPTGWYMLCTVGGTSGDGDITFPSPLTEDASVMDGTVVWRLHKLSTSVANIDSLEKYLAESTGYGIVSGCEPTISGLTVTVGAGVVHLADGTRKELSASTVTLDAADSTNPRIDLVYITSAGEVAKVTGTAAASPSTPVLPSNGIKVCVVTVAANANTGTVTDTRKRAFRAEDKVSFLFPQNLNPDEVGECQLIVTNEKVMMIDSHYDTNGQFNYLVEYIKKKGIKKIDVFLLSHYHLDHYGNIDKFLNNQSDIDFSTTKWYIPYYTNTGDSAKATVISWLQSANADYEELTEDKKITLADNVTVDIICNSAEFHAAIDSGKDPNPHSNYALVKHGDVNVLFTGDGFAPEIQYILDNYNLPKIDLIKLQHHGTVSNKSAADTTFFRKIAAKYAVMNYGHDHYEKEGAWGKNDGYSSYVNYFGGKTYHACYNDVEFISDGKNIKHLTANVPAKSYQFTTALHFYVDKSADINITPDGSISKPFTSIMEAVKAIPSDEAKVYIHVKAGTYHSLRIESFKGEIQISKEGTGTINVEHISINNVGRVFMDGISANQVRIFSAYCVFDGLTLNVTEKTSDTFTSDLRKPNSTTGGTDGGFGIALDDCRARIGSLTINGNNNSSLTAIVNAEKSLIDIRTCIINNTSSAVFVGGRSCYISIGDLTVNNATEYIVGTYWGAIVDLQHTPKITNYSKSGLGGTSSRWWLDGKTQGMGANRPANVITPLNYLYFDTTLKKLLIFDGSAWVDTTTGNTVS